MPRKSVGEMRMELAEHQREQRRLQDGTCEGANGCMGDQEHQIPEDLDSTHAGSHVCAYHYKAILGDESCSN